MDPNTTSSAALKMRSPLPSIWRKGLNAENNPTPPSQGKNFLLTFPFIEPVPEAATPPTWDRGQKIARFGSLKEATAPCSSTMNQTIDPLNAKEAAWIKTQLENASKFVEGFSPQDSGQPLTLSALDRAFAAWIASEPVDTDLVNAVINYVGIAFGQALVDGIGLKWVIATDDQGSELAVYGFPGRGDVLVYPANFVAKRWERRETNFLESAYQKIGKDARAVFRNWHRSSGS